MLQHIRDLLIASPFIKRIPNPFRANCFVAGTLVQTTDGSGREDARPIEEVKPGDLVLAKDETTGKVSARRVTGTSRRTVDTVWKLTLAASCGKVVENITTTAGHPFYVAGKGFTLAGMLREGDRIATRAGAPLIVQSLASEHRPGGYTVYNLEVEEDHTYFVGSSAGGVWVHNNVTCTGATTSPTSSPRAALPIRRHSASTTTSSPTAPIA